MNNERKITKKQLDYIEILSGHPSTKDADKKDMDDFLTTISKNRIQECNTKEASNPIKILIRRKVEYTFICGKKADNEQRECC
jgi:hypothetical protein